MPVLPPAQPTYNETGDKIAIAYYQTIPQHVRVNKSHDYIFSVRAKICMAWVNVEDVDAVLSIVKKCGCANSKPKHVYRYASEADVRRWMGISGR